MQRIPSITLCCLALALLLAAACKKDTVTAPGYEDGVSTVIYDLPGDTGTTVGGDSARPFRDFYFNFSERRKITDTAVKQTLDWDIAFTDIYNSMIAVNSGANKKSPGYGGAGKGAIVYYDKPYASITEAPSDEYFAANDLGRIGWDGYPTPADKGWYFYTLTTHIAVPLQNRTFVLRTASGKYAKLEIINIYKGNPPAVTDMMWPVPYFTFRYYVQENGSRNLSTPQ
ncbi:HmuY family protein [Chitinophaga japonensis]|uniref:Heme-binding HmuY-like protein n=1 Tax=Chitinophaga japonensis TaxID=104662 RepID=A0A562TC08_CHIJA|nr:HmuY family protein [Chitinophaga japonensis]TWI91049.1 heme-binding HmuY-like protein [Chitinophaga japonensis]